MFLDCECELSRNLVQKKFLKCLHFVLKRLTLAPSTNKYQPKMKHITIDGTFATSSEAIQNVKDSQISRLKPVNDRQPMIVKSKVSAKKILYGVQYWTKEMIERGTYTNSDGSISVYCK